MLRLRALRQVQGDNALKQVNDELVRECHPELVEGTCVINTLHYSYICTQIDSLGFYP